jgi:hypothetical protein
MAPGFRPVGWVAAVAGAALGCYMLSLNVASERAELSRIERQIIATKQEIRLLQTELGTRGRMAQLEQWNADVLALAAPASNQFLDSEMKLARFDQRAPTIEERAQLHMAAADIGQDVISSVESPVLTAAAETVPSLGSQPLVRRASFAVPAIGADQGVKPAKPQAAPAAGKPERAANPATSTKIQLAAAQPVAPIKPAAEPKQTGGKRIGDQLARVINAAARSEAASERR